MRMVAVAVCVVSALLLFGCASAVTAVEKTCISDGMEEGGRLRHLQTGRVGVVEVVHGESDRCLVIGGWRTCGTSRVPSVV